MWADDREMAAAGAASHPPTVLGAKAEGPAPAVSVMTMPEAAAPFPKSRALQLAQCRVRGSPDLRKVPSHLIWNHGVLRANIL